jgi:MFS family permease
MPRWFGAWLGLNAESPQAYQGVLWVSTLLMLAAAVPFWFIRAGGAGAPVGLRARPRLTLRNRALAIRILTPHILGAFAAGMIVPFANVLWRMSYQLADATIGNIFALSALLMALFGLVSPLLTARLGRVRVMIMVQGLAIVGLLAFGFAPLLGFAVVGFLTRDILLNWMRPLYGQFMMELSDPAERAAVSAWATMGFNLAWGVSSWISGELQSAGELAWVFGGSACVALGALVAFARFFGTGETPRAREVLAHPFGVSAE